MGPGLWLLSHQAWPDPWQQLQWCLMLGLPRSYLLLFVLRSPSWMGVRIQARMPDHRNFQPKLKLCQYQSNPTHRDSGNESGSLIRTIFLHSMLPFRSFTSFSDRGPLNPSGPFQSNRKVTPFNLGRKDGGTSTCLLAYSLAVCNITKSSPGISSAC